MALAALLAQRREVELGERLVEDALSELDFAALSSGNER